MDGISEPMQRALEAALAARGRTSPNPWVGAAVVRDGQVVATGATGAGGRPHAEAEAIAADRGRGGTLYVTLEPCAPFDGKRSQPCAEAIVGAGFERVVIAMEDPDSNVRGRGTAILRAAGVAVDVGDGAKAAADLLRPYIKHRQTGLPYVIAKFAASLDGRAATRTGDSKWITGEAARDLGHRQRAWVDAVMVGSGTVLADDPALTARPGGRAAERQPVRVVLDARGRLAPTARLLREPGPVIVATACEAPAGWKREIAGAGATVIDCGAAPSGGLNLDQLLRTLGERGIMSIWAEGGGTLLGALFDGGHADEVWAFIAPVVIGGDGLPAVGGAGARSVAEAWRLREPVVETIESDVLVRGYIGDWSP